MKTLAVLLVGAALVLSIPATAHAVLPFGGLITKIVECPTGTGKIAIVAAPPPIPSGPYAILAKVIEFPFFIDKPTSFILGLYTPGDVCGMKVWGTVYMKGTSL